MWSVYLYHEDTAFPQAALKTSHSVLLRNLRFCFPSQFFWEHQKGTCLPQSPPLVFCRAGVGKSQSHGAASTFLLLLYLLRWMQYLHVNTELVLVWGSYYRRWTSQMVLNTALGLLRLVSSWSGLLWGLCAASPQNAALCCFAGCSGLFVFSMLGLWYLGAISSFKKCYKAKFYFQFCLCTQKYWHFLGETEVIFFHKIPDSDA